MADYGDMQENRCPQCGGSGCNSCGGTGFHGGGAQGMGNGANADPMGMNAAFANVAFKVVAFGPIILAIVFGFLWGALGKLKTVGRAIQSVIVGFCLGSIPLSIVYQILVKIFGGVQSMNTGFIAVFSILLAISGAFVTIFYFRKVYPVFVRMGVLEFTNCVRNASVIGWFGTLAGGIISFISKGVGETIMSIAFLAMIVFFVVWIKPFIKEAKENKHEVPKAKIAKLVSAAIVAVCFCIFSFTTLTAFNSTTEARTQLAAERMENITGQSVASSMYNFYIYSEPSGDSNAFGPLSPGETMTATGALSGMWLPVEYQDTKGWVYAPFVNYSSPDGQGYTMPVIGTSFYPYKAVVTVPLSAKVVGNSPLFTLEAGTEITISAAAGGSNPYLHFTYAGENNTCTLQNGQDAVFIVPVE